MCPICAILWIRSKGEVRRLDKQGVQLGVEVGVRSGKWRVKKHLKGNWGREEKETRWVRGRRQGI